MSALGIGQDGYARLQKSTYGTPATNSMTEIPLLESSQVSAMVQQIENKNIMFSRVRQLPNAGRNKVSGNIDLHAYPSLLGKFFNLLFGTSTDGLVDDGTYEHTFLVSLTASGAAKYFTYQQARGLDTAEQYNDCVLLGMKITSDSQGNIVFSYKMMGKSLTDGVSRIVSASYPAETPYKFSHLSVTIDPLTPANDSATPLSLDSFELEYDSGLTEENFKAGSIYSVAPVVEKIPTLTMKCGLNADGRYDGYARPLERFSCAIEMLHTEAAAGSTPYRTQIEIPKMILARHSDTKWQ